MRFYVAIALARKYGTTALARYDSRMRHGAWAPTQWLSPRATSFRGYGGQGPVCNAPTTLGVITLTPQASQETARGGFADVCEGAGVAMAPAIASDQKKNKRHCLFGCLLFVRFFVFLLFICLLACLFVRLILFSSVSFLFSLLFDDRCSSKYPNLDGYFDKVFKMTK